MDLYPLQFEQRPRRLEKAGVIVDQEAAQRHADSMSLGSPRVQLQLTRKCCDSSGLRRPVAVRLGDALGPSAWFARALPGSRMTYDLGRILLRSGDQDQVSRG
jgi:hypothetical protein